MKYVLFSAILLLSSCGSRGLPKKPSINVCAHLYSENIATCVNNQTGEASDLHIADTDRYIMMSPDHYGLLLKYLRVIEGRFPKRVKKEVTKFTNASAKLHGLTDNR